MPAIYVSSTLACYQFNPGEVSLGGIATITNSGGVQFKHTRPDLYWMETPRFPDMLHSLGVPRPLAAFDSDNGNMQGKADSWQNSQLFPGVSVIVSTSHPRVFAFISG